MLHSVQASTAWEYRFTLTPQALVCAPEEPVPSGPSVLPYELRVAEALLAETVRQFESRRQRVQLLSAGTEESLSFSAMKNPADIYTLLPIQRWGRVCQLDAHHLPAAAVPLCCTQCRLLRALLHTTEGNSQAHVAARHMRGAFPLSLHPECSLPSGPLQLLRTPCPRWWARVRGTPCRVAARLSSLRWQRCRMNAPRTVHGLPSQAVSGTMTAWSDCGLDVGGSDMFCTSNAAHASLQGPRSCSLTAHQGLLQLAGR